MKITATRTAYTAWVCVDCLYAHHGLDKKWRASDLDRTPLSLLPSLPGQVSAGLLFAEHEEDCPIRPTTTRSVAGVTLRTSPRQDVECYCEQIDFTWHACQGCGSQLGGSRHALTVWP